ncbi:cupin [Flavobacteriaceae bacterium CRH]|nr:cupin [Flavobacteriaceae bacterium CRH]
MTESNLIFLKGKKIINNNFKGAAWVTMLMENDTLYDTQIGNVTFDPGARTNWHYHKGGQILLITQGKGYYQEKGKQIQIMKKGQVIKCPPNIIHWHGATPNDTLVHVAISTNTNKGAVVWLEPVSDNEYSKFQNN